MSTGIDAAALVPVIVDRALRRLADQQLKAFTGPTGAPGGEVEQLTRVAELYRREARWWGVLSRWAYSEHPNAMSLVFGKAAIRAEVVASERAARYDEFAASARRRAALAPSEFSGVAA